MPSQNIATIDPAEINIIFGVARLTGFASGQYFSAVKRNDDFTYEEGADGEGVRVRNPSNAWDIQVTLMQSSRSNDALDLLHTADKVTPGGVLTSLAVSHQGTNLVSAKAFITKRPDITYSDGIETRVWSFVATFFEGTIQGITS